MDQILLPILAVIALIAGMYCFKTGKLTIGGLLSIIAAVVGVFLFRKNSDKTEKSKTDVTQIKKKKKLVEDSLNKLKNSETKKLNAKIQVVKKKREKVKGNNEKEIKKFKAMKKKINEAKILTEIDDELQDGFNLDD